MTRQQHLRDLLFRQLSDNRCQQASRLAPHRRMICCKYAAKNWKYAATLTHLGARYSLPCSASTNSDRSSVGDVRQAFRRRSQSSQAPTDEIQQEPRPSVSLGKQQKPPASNFLVVPRLHHIGSTTKNQVKMIAQHRVGQAIDPKNRSKKFQSRSDPVTPMLIANSRIGIATA